MHRLHSICCICLSLLAVSCLSPVQCLVTRPSLGGDEEEWRSIGGGAEKTRIELTSWSSTESTTTEKGVINNLRGASSPNPIISPSITISDGVDGERTAGAVSEFRVQLSLNKDRYSILDKYGREVLFRGVNLVLHQERPAGEDRPTSPSVYTRESARRITSTCGSTLPSAVWTMVKESTIKTRTLMEVTISRR
jgi:hypothetical protein